MILLVGPSASGKTEIAKKLCFSFGYRKFVTTTTRHPRAKEKDGIDYYFVSKEKFLKRLGEGKFIETTSYDENLYGSEKGNIALDKVLIVDPNGLKSFIALKDPSIVTFFLKCDEKIREKRMILRGDEASEIKKRLILDNNKFDKKVENSCLFVLNTSFLDVETLAQKVDKMYKDYIKINRLLL
jgi:guanylate kinase